MKIFVASDRDLEGFWFGQAILREIKDAEYLKVLYDEAKPGIELSLRGRDFKDLSVIASHGNHPFNDIAKDILNFKKTNIETMENLTELFNQKMNESQNQISQTIEMENGFLISESELQSYQNVSVPSEGSVFDFEVSSSDSEIENP